MIRFAREFHQSDFEQFKICPRMFYYRAVLGTDPERTSEFAIAGIAMHATFAKAHTEKIWDGEALFAFWREDFEKRVAETCAAGIDARLGFIPATSRHFAYRSFTSVRSVAAPIRLPLTSGFRVLSVTSVG